MTKAWKLFLFCAALLAWPSVASAQLISFCSESYQNSGACPDHQCRLACNRDGAIWEGCALNCFPKLCVELSAKECPLDECQILKGCTEEDVCYPKVDDSTLVCGEASYPGQNVPCCDGMIKRCGIEFFDGTCDMESPNSLDGVAICIPCGNGVCNQFENRCNCPEDCKTPNP